MQYVYILKCKDLTYYTGCTNNLDRRFLEHQEGKVKSTLSKTPVEIVWYCAFQEKHKAYQFEKYLKSGSGIAFRNKRFIEK